jgi:hypothetical protein
MSVMGASCVDGWVGGFYAPRAKEGNGILQNKPFTSVEKVRGYTKSLILPLYGPEGSSS